MSISIDLSFHFPPTSLSSLSSIDTPGVIDRVSKLFNGNPYLIQGFNTFLPVGYRIEVSADPSDPNTITVTTPQGTTTKSTNGTVISPRPPRDPQALPPPGHGNPLLYPPSAPPPAPTANIPGGSASRSHTPAAYHITPHGQVPFDLNALPPAFTPGQPSQPSNQVAAAASFLGNLHGRQAPPAANSAAQVDKDGNGQFNNAIQYLNKIKLRYSDDPETYKQFLDVLQTYKKDTCVSLLLFQYCLTTIVIGHRLCRLKCLFKSNTYSRTHPNSWLSLRFFWEK